MIATAKMNYSDKKIATMIHCKMAKRHPEDKWQIVQLPTGFQVCRVQTIPAFMPPAKPRPVKPAMSE